ncbi:MAG TPA: hypothetical protein VF595_05110 [Tepidisphaeraceae bacterium]|jgi:hypothetical protein
MPPKTKLIVAGSLGAIVLVIAAGMFAGVPALQPGVLVVVKNSDPAAISNVQVFVGGKVIGLGTIAPGATASGRAVPSADSDVAIQYIDAVGAQQAVRVDTYVTGGYRGRIDAEVRGGSLVSSCAELH